MLDHEETNEQARRWHCQQQAQPMAADKNNRHHSQMTKKGGAETNSSKTPRALSGLR
jgi:hypothetical protein